MFNLLVDRIIKGKAYPALARHSAEPYTPQWREFVQHWPNTVPCELIEHCSQHGYPYQLLTADNYEQDLYYPIGIGFFNFDVDYIGLLPAAVLEQVQSGRVRLLFYYHEGDNPYNIQRRLDWYCDLHGVSRSAYVIVSGNTAADQIANSVWFPDHELLYWHRNQHTPPTAIPAGARPWDFTLLSRTHKWWRATVVADLERTGVLGRSQWSYNTELAAVESITDNPIEIDTIDIRADLHRFVARGPYHCDTLTAAEHNDHSQHVAEHYTDSYCSIVLETLFDCDGSGGAFLTEKTFKCLKHGHPFVVVGAAGSLAALRSLGYRVFDGIIDNTYDTIADNTRRWQHLRLTIQELQSRLGPEFIEQCRPDLEHNQRLFTASKHNRLNRLNQQLTTFL